MRVAEEERGSVDQHPLTIRGNDQSGCTIVISDTGHGFDSASVPAARLGLRVSIQERVASVGGAVEVRTSPGEGTTIVLTWPRPDLSDERVASLAGHDVEPLGAPS